MPNQKNRSRNQRRRQGQPPSPPAQSVTQSVSSETKTVDAIDRAAKSPNQAKPPEQQSPAALWLETWLPIIFNGLVVCVIVIHAFYYNKQWKAMESALNETRVSRQIEDRAWISLTEAQVQGGANPGEVLLVSAKIKNSGNSPAVNTVIKAGISIEDDIILPNRPLRPSDLSGFTSDLSEPPFILGPGVEHLINSRPMPVSDQGAFNRKNNITRIKIFGVVEYEDIFRRKHWMTFCNFSEYPFTGMRSCGGSIDEQEGTEN